MSEVSTVLVKQFSYFNSCFTDTVDTSQTPHRQSADNQPTVHQQNYWLTDLAVFWSPDGRLTADSISEVPYGADS